MAKVATGMNRDCDQLIEMFPAAEGLAITSSDKDASEVASCGLVGVCFRDLVGDELTLILDERQAARLLGLLEKVLEIRRACRGFERFARLTAEAEA